MTKNNRIYNKLIPFFLLIFFLTGVLISQPGIDSRQGGKELEIMKSVISTSLAMTRKDLRSEEEKGNRNRRYESFLDADAIEGYYLHGQGVVFTIPYPCLAGNFAGELHELEISLDVINEMDMGDIDQLVDETAFLESQVELQRHELEMQRHEFHFNIPSPPRPPEPPHAPEVPGIEEEQESAEISRSSERNIATQKEVEKRVARIKTNLRKVREESEEQKENADVERKAIKQELINVVAVHGDSLTQVKENEFINLVLRDRCDRFGWSDEESSQTVLSIRKSDITAYRSGQLTLEQLKSSFVEY
jgi:hypothetical protein